uniref:V-type proton ATPase subunit a n=1 Tax=Syphacia muris TaxID=451379 RepID=A0A0N5ABB5_9BILA
MFVRDIRRYDELERKLRFICEQIKKDDIELAELADENNYEVMAPYESNQLEATLIDLEKDLLNMNESELLLRKKYLEVKEWEAILEKADQFLQGGISDLALEEIESVAEDEGMYPGRTSKEPMTFLSGIITRERVNAFERVIWRACRRTAFVRTAEIAEPLFDPDSGENVYKSVFIIFCKGEKLKNIIEKVCEGFKAKLYSSCPTNSKDRHAASRDVRARITDLQTVMGQTQEHRFKVLKAAAGNLKEWRKQIRLQKAVYHTLNLFTFDSIGKFFVAECWIPLSDLENVRQALERGVENSGSTVKPVLNLLETSEEPPTYNKVNKFTEVFQGIVDSYGIASYLEVNPAPFTIISFPFIFACMFGDLGHGFVMFLGALFFVLKEDYITKRKIKDEIFNTFFGGRYIILLMGLFSIHAGFLYNDLFAKSFNIFGSSWRNPYSAHQLQVFENQSLTLHKTVLLEMEPTQAFLQDRGPYLFGMDPVWNLAENKLNFLNSLKMKLSVIIGIAQMTFGVALSLMNYTFFKSKIEVFTVFIPQMLFMLCIFIYLCLEIIVKWIAFSAHEDVIFGQIYPGSHCAPSLLIGLINMFMFKDRNVGFVNETHVISNAGGHTQYLELPSCYLGQWYPGQSSVEAVLVIVAVLCIPVMLFGKPIYMLVQQKKAKNRELDKMIVRVNMEIEETEILTNQNGKIENIENSDSKTVDRVASETIPAEHRTHKEEQESFGDIMVHQAIHTIEYVLGCVSHTASYLRLWALSLAHAQLSEVLWSMVLEQSFSLSGVAGYVALYVIFIFFAILTVSILVLMEGLSAFLHAIRLHWVEFQSKFYLGLGYQFMPLYFKDVLMRAGESD